MNWLYILVCIILFLVTINIMYGKPKKSNKTIPFPPDNDKGNQFLISKYNRLISGLLALKKARIGNSETFPNGIATSINSRLGQYSYIFFIIHSDDFLKIKYFWGFPSQIANIFITDPSSIDRVSTAITWKYSSSDSQEKILETIFSHLKDKTPELLN